MGISDDIIKQISGALNKVKGGRSMRRAGTATVASIKKRTRLGKAPQQHGKSLRRIQKLDNQYKKTRRKLKKQGKLSSKTTPAKSNLTQTGEMLDNLDYKTMSDGFIITFKTKGAAEKADWVSQNARPFLFLSKVEIKRIVEILLDRLKRSI